MKNAGFAGAARKNRISRGAVGAFILSVLMCSVIVVITIINRNNVERLEMERLIMEKSIRINEVISRLLYKTEALAALVLQDGGDIRNFEKVAATIVDDPAILNILIAPDGVVSKVYPIQGNEAVIGFDLFSDGEGNMEALLAKETGQLVFGGPFTLVQGGQALVGRLPVYYMDSSSGKREFWGLVSVTLKYPQALDGVGLDVFKTQEFEYEIWRISPDTGERQIILASENQPKKNMRFIEKHVQILNADWYFRVSPIRMWYQYTENWVLIVSGLLVSLMVAFVMQNNHDLRNMKSEIESLSRLDPMTEIYNRGYFIEAAKSIIKEAESRGEGCFIVILDLDKFKRVNDTYGHQAGDKVIIEFANRMICMLPPTGLFARYGGEEFVILFSGMDKDEVMRVTERIRLSICEEPFIVENNSLEMSVSFGISRVNSPEELDKSSRLADKALYTAKDKGRNRVEFYEDL